MTLGFKTKASETRPWGSFKVLESERRFWVKELTVKPKKRLSKQYHLKRSEIWLVLEGTVLVELDGRRKRLKKQETTFIPTRAVHRISNNSNETARILEFAFGVCKEDDIIRIEDDFGRSKVRR